MRKGHAEVTNRPYRGDVIWALLLAHLALIMGLDFAVGPSDLAIVVGWPVKWSWEKA